MAGIEYKPTTSQVASVADYFNGASSNLARGIQNFGSGFGTLGNIVQTTQTNRALDDILSKYDPNNPTATSAAITSALANRPDISPEMRMYMNTTLRDNLFKSADQENLYNAKRTVDALQNEVNAQLANANISGLNKANLALRDSGVRSDALQFGDKDKLLNSAAERDLKGTSANLNRAKLKDQEDLRFANDATAALTSQLFNYAATKQYSDPKIVKAELYKAAQMLSQRLPGLEGLDSAVQLRAIETAVAKTLEYLDSGFESAYPIQNTDGSFTVKRRNLVTGKDTSYNVPYHIAVPGVGTESAVAKSSTNGAPNTAPAVVDKTIDSSIGRGDFTPEAPVLSSPVAAQTTVQAASPTVVATPAANAAANTNTQVPAAQAQPTTPTIQLPSSTTTTTPVQAAPVAAVDTAVTQAIVPPANNAPGQVVVIPPELVSNDGGVTEQEQQKTTQAKKVLDDTIQRTVDDIARTAQGVNNISGVVNAPTSIDIPEDITSRKTKRPQNILSALANSDDANNIAVIDEIANKAVERVAKSNNDSSTLTPSIIAPTSPTNGTGLPQGNAPIGAEGTTASFTENKDAVNRAWRKANVNKPQVVTSPTGELLGKVGKKGIGSSTSSLETPKENIDDVIRNYQKDIALNGLDSFSERMLLADYNGIAMDKKIYTPDEARIRDFNLEDDVTRSKSAVEELRQKANSDLAALSQVDFSKDLSPEEAQKTDYLFKGTIANLSGMASHLNTFISANTERLHSANNLASVGLGDTLKDATLAKNGLSVSAGEADTVKDLGFTIGKDTILTTENIASSSNRQIVDGFLNSLEGNWSWTGNERKVLFGHFNRIQAKIYNTLSTGSGSYTDPTTGNKVTAFNNTDALKYSKMLALSIVQTSTEDYTDTTIRGGQGDYDFNEEVAQKLTKHCIQTLRDPNSETAKAIIELDKINSTKNDLASAYSTLVSQKDTIARQKKLIDPDNPFASNSLLSAAIYNRLNAELPQLGTNLNNSFLKAYSIFR